MSKVSFILPAYKREFLGEAIASILAQTYRDFELIVVDDCSPENLKDVVDGFRDDRLVYRRNEKNIGCDDLVAAWEHALRYATCDWCVLASDDDIYATTYLQEMIQLSEKYPKADLFHARQLLVDESGKIGKLGEPRTEFETDVEMAYNRVILRFMQTAPEFMFRMDALRKIGGFVRFPRAWFSDDATWLALSRNGVGCSQHPLFKFRNSGLNISSRNNDVIQKVVAGEMFKVWYREFLLSLTPMTDLERQLIELSSKQCESAIDSVAMLYMQNLSLLQWMKCYRQVKTPYSQRLAFVYKRFPFVYGIRSLIRC